MTAKESEGWYMEVVLGQAYGRLTAVKRWPYGYRGYRRKNLAFNGQPFWLVVCTCGAQTSMPEGRILNPPYPWIQACDGCQPHVRVPGVPDARRDPKGHALVDALIAEGMSPLEAFFAYRRATDPPPVATPAQRRALRLLESGDAADLGVRVAPRVLAGLERLRWVADGKITDLGLRTLREG